MQNGITMYWTLYGGNETMFTSLISVTHYIIIICFKETTCIALCIYCYWTNTCFYLKLNTYKYIVHLTTSNTKLEQILHTIILWASSYRSCVYFYLFIFFFRIDHTHQNHLKNTKTDKQCIFAITFQSQPNPVLMKSKNHIKQGGKLRPRRQWNDECVYARCSRVVGPRDYVWGCCTGCLRDIGVCIRFGLYGGYIVYRIIYVKNLSLS